MSATKDGSIGTGFIYTNFYEHYRHMTVGKILRHSQSKPASDRVMVQATDQDFGAWIRGESSDPFKQNPVTQNLAQSMNELRRHSKRLKTLVKEVDELLKRK